MAVALGGLMRVQGGRACPQGCQWVDWNPLPVASVGALLKLLLRLLLLLLLLE